MVAQAAESQLVLYKTAVEWRMPAGGFAILKVRRGRRERRFLLLRLMPVKLAPLRNC